MLPHAKKLRDYVDRGGFIFAEACCGDSQRFDDGFRQLMAAVFPEPEYQLQQLTPGHPIWRMQDMVRPDSPYVGRLWGVEYGCRTCVVYSDAGPVVLLGARPARPMEASSRSAVDEHIADALAIGVNVLTYATNREPKGKEQSFVTPLADDEVDCSDEPRRHRNRQAPPRRRLQRRARRTGEPAAHRLAGRAASCASAPRRS